MAKIVQNLPIFAKLAKFVLPNANLAKKILPYCYLFLGKII